MKGFGDQMSRGLGTSPEGPRGLGFMGFRPSTHNHRIPPHSLNYHVDSTETACTKCLNTWTLRVGDHVQESRFTSAPVSNPWISFLPKRAVPSKEPHQAHGGLSEPSVSHVALLLAVHLNSLNPNL